MSDEVQQREKISETLQSTINELSPEGKGGYLSGWITIMEWVSPSGERWISRVFSGGSTEWQRDGWLHYGLNKFDRGKN